MINGEMRLAKPIRWAMVGGGRDSHIGYSHRTAALRDGIFQLLAGAFDIDPERGRDFGVQLRVAPERCYADYRRLFAEEARRPDGIQAVSIATPNGSHFAICKAALEAGLHVVCEKPLCFTVAEAEELRALAERNHRIVGVTYGYAGYQMIEQARRMIANGDLGEIRIVTMQFAHGAHSAPVETADPSVQWRVDPAVAGPSYVLGDLGTHPFYLSQVMLPDLRIASLMCARQSFVKSRAPLEDNAFAIMRYDNGAVGTMWASAVNAGATHSQKLRVTGSLASIEWWDERPNQLAFEVQGQPARILERGMDYLYPEARADDRIGGGHPEGIFESWANLYYRFAVAMDAADRGDAALLREWRYPDIHAGVAGVRFVANCVRSADNGGSWVDYV
jgi:predicted dehydrogenase